MSETSIAEVGKEVSPRDEIEITRDKYMQDRLRVLRESSDGRDSNEVLVLLVENLYQSSSKPHILTCAAQGEAAARFTVDTLANLDLQGDVANNVAEEMVDVMSFEQDLDQFIGDLLVVDSLTYDEAYTDIAPDDKANLQQFYRNPTRGIYPSNTGEIKNLRTKAGKLGVELSSRISALGLDPTSGKYKDELKTYKEMSEDALMKTFDDAIDANETGNVSLLDQSMKKVVDHFATGDFLIWEESTQRWRDKLEG